MCVCVLSLCCVQAAICKDPVSIYKHMRGHGIGTKYAPYYKAFATTLAERGERGEAIRVLEGGVQAEARPLNLLTQFITELKGGQISKTVQDDKVTCGLNIIMKCQPFFLPLVV